MGVGCDGDMCARRSAPPETKRLFQFFSFLYLRADTHSHAIAAEGLMGYGLGILPPCVGWFVLTAPGDYRLALLLAQTRLS